MDSSTGLLGWDILKGQQEELLDPGKMRPASRAWLRGGASQPASLLGMLQSLASLRTKLGPWRHP